MRALWIDEGDNPAWDKIAPLQFTDLYFSARAAYPAQLDAARARGYRCGIYWASSWAEPTSSPFLWADTVNNHWLSLKGNVKRLDVQFDIEEHSPEDVLECFTAWRRLRPFAVTSWTLEGFQGGWATAVRDSIVSLKITVVPQCYEGDMTPLDVGGVTKDLVDYGFPYATITPFHDARSLHRGWYGFAFTQGRLP